MKKLLLASALFAMSLTMAAENPFAYNISAEGIPAGGVLDAGVTELSISYTLNANAVSVGVIFMNGDNEAKRIAFDDSSLFTKGDHQTTVSLEGLPTGVQLKWKVYAEGEVLTAPSAITRINDPSGNQLKVWGPYAMAVDNNPESEHFGRVLYTESHAGVLGNTGYFAVSNGVGLGVYELDPQHNLVKNAAGTYGYNGGITWTKKNYTSYENVPGTDNSAIFGPKRVKISKDGRIFVSIADLDNCPLYEMNPDNLDQWTPVLEGSYNQEVEGRPGRWWVSNNGEVIGAAGHGLDVKGEGDDLKVALYYCGNGLGLGLPSYCGAMEYPLGTATSIAIASEVEALKGKYTQNPQYADIAYDGRGGILYTHYRGISATNFVILSYINAQGVETGTIIQNDVNMTNQGAGIVFNDDYSLVALSTNRQEITIYKVGYGDEVENPTIDLGDLKLTQLYKISSNGFNGNNALGFDIANNLYTCTNNAERLGYHALPREEPICAVPARAEFAFQIPAAMVTVTGKITKAPREAANNGAPAYIAAGEGIEGAQVVFNDGTNEYSGITDAAGDYSINMPAGTYTVTVSEPNHYIPYTEENVVVSDDPTAAPVLNFSLQYDYTTAVSDVKTATTVVAVKYYDLNGKECAEPIKGVNVKVTIMSDGSRVTEKILK